MHFILKYKIFSSYIGIHKCLNLVFTSSMQTNIANWTKFGKTKPDQIKPLLFLKETIASPSIPPTRGGGGNNKKIIETNTNLLFNFNMLWYNRRCKNIVWTEKNIIFWIFQEVHNVFSSVKSNAIQTLSMLRSVISIFRDLKSSMCVHQLEAKIRKSKF